MEFCICGHPKKVHTPKIWKHRQFDIADYMQEACFYGMDEPPKYCNCNKFKLDNLRLIEELAKKRGLVK